MTPEQLTNLLRTHQVYPNFLPKDARLADLDKDCRTGDLLFVFESASAQGSTADHEAITFPVVGFRGDGKFDK